MQRNFGKLNSANQRLRFTNRDPMGPQELLALLAPLRERSGYDGAAVIGTLFRLNFTSQFEFYKNLEQRYNCRPHPESLHDGEKGTHFRRVDESSAKGDAGAR